MLALCGGGAGLLALAGAALLPASWARGHAGCGRRVPVPGPPLPPVLGFLSGWISFLVGFSAPLAGFGAGLPAIHLWVRDRSDAHAELPRQLLALAVVAGLTAVHLRGLHSGGEVPERAHGREGGLILALIAAGALSGRGDLAHLGMSADAAEATSPSAKTMGLALMWIMFAYSGWNSSGYVGGRSAIRSGTCPVRCWQAHFW